MMNYLNTYRRYPCDIKRVNKEAVEDPEGFIAMTESIYEYDLRLIADQICSLPGKYHVVLLSGPSSSGKTTTALKLSDEFRRNGIAVKRISMDDFYLGKDYVRKLQNGKPDFESVEALDIPLIKKTLYDLASKGEAVKPLYDFKNSTRKKETELISAKDFSVIIMEGIHALNPIISDGMPREAVKKIYVSVKQGIKDNEDYILTNRELRFVRRMLRDHSFRKTDPGYLLSMWESIVDGEKQYIRPFRYTSDFTVNSIHIYEPCIYKKLAAPLFEGISRDHENYEFAAHIAESLDKFADIDSSLVPENSLIREFIGGGCYSY